MTPLECMKNVYALMRQGNWSEVENCLSEDFTVYEPESLPFGGEWRGKDALKRLFTAVMTTFDEPAVDPIEMSGGDEWANYILHFSGTSKATGKRSTYRVIESAKVVEGVMRELHLHYFDTAKIVTDLSGEEA
ncbi:MAG: nuclear transport factor 2 family protein [Henriciella sp.]